MGLKIVPRPVRFRLQTAYANPGTRPAAKIAQEQAKAGLVSSMGKNMLQDVQGLGHVQVPCWNILVHALRQVRYFYTGHDHAFSINERHPRNSPSHMLFRRDVWGRSVDHME